MNEQRLRDALPDDTPLDVQEEIIDLLTGDNQLPVDMGLEVIVTQVDGDAFDAPHFHEPGEDTLVLHLPPVEAQATDELLREIVAECIIQQENSK